MNNTQRSMYALIQRFVERQELAFITMQKLHPDKLAMTSADISIEDLYALVDKFSHVPFVGDTGEDNEWRCWFHGLGIKLANKVTSEPIQWDAPNPEAFDRYWFADWLVWLLSQTVLDEDGTVIKPVLREDIQHGIDELFRQLLELNFSESRKLKWA